jgi:hypothetical protein
MFTKSTIFYTLLCIFIVILLLEIVFIKVYEGFKNAEKTKDETSLNTYMTILNDSFCPVISHMIKETINRNALTGSEEDTKKTAMELLTLEANGPIFLCPAPNDPADIPADIGDRIVISAVYLYKKVSKALIKVKKALNCEKLTKEESREGFYASVEQNAEIPLNVSKEEKDAAKEAAKPSSSKKTLSKLDRELLIKQRLSILNETLSNSKLTGLIALIQSKANELLTIKKLAEENKIKPTCQKNEEGEASSINF